MSATRSGTIASDARLLCSGVDAGGRDRGWLRTRRHPTTSIFLTGEFETGFDLGGGPLPNTGAMDLFIARFSP